MAWSRSFNCTRMLRRVLTSLPFSITTRGLRFCRLILLPATVALAAMLVSCSDSSKPVAATQPISVAFSTISAPPSSLLTGATAKFAVVVNNDSFNDGVTWAATCGSTGADACGTFDGPGSASNVAIEYTAPAQAPTGNTVTVTATSVSDTTKSVSATITIVAPLSVAFSSNTVIPATLLTGAQLTLAAVVSNDPAKGGVTWSVTCGSAGACGTFSTGSTSSGATTVYTAPALVPDGNSVILTATSVSDPTTSVQATISIVTISVVFSPVLPSSIPPGAQRPFTAVVNNDPANGGVTWAVTCGSSGACGTFSAASTASGTPTTYTAPATAPTGGSVTVAATSVTDPTKSAQTVIAIGVPSMADGTYVFSLSGLNQSAQPYFVAGTIVVSGGSITSGEQDFHGLGVADTDLINSAGSGIATSTDGNLLITLTTCSGTNCNTADTNVGVNGVETFDGSIVSTSRLLIAEFDKSSTASGTLDLQTSTAAPSGGYAFYLGGIDVNALSLAMGGVINVDSPGNILGAGSVFDINDGYYYSSNFGFILADQAFSASTVSAPDTFGRVVFNLVPNAASNLGAISLAGYIVDAAHIRLVEDSDSLNADTGGSALGQGTSTGTFSSATISGSSFVFSALGKDGNGAFQAAGVVSTNSGGAVSGTLNYNDLYTGAQSPIAFTGTYTVDPTGRVTLSNLTDPGLVNAQMYLTGNGSGAVGTMISMDTTDTAAGFAYQQTGTGSFTAGSFGGKYVMDATGNDPGQSELDAVGPTTADGVSALTGTADLNWLFHSGPTASLTVSGAFTAAPSGIFTGTIQGLDVTTPANQDAFTYYVIDTTKVVAIETDSNQLTLVYFELQ